MHWYSRSDVRVLEDKLMKKFNGLFKNSPWCKLSRMDTVVNLSRKPIKFYESVVLGFGFKFEIGVNYNNILETVKSLELFR